VKFFVGIGSYQLDMPSCSSLKDKRRFIKSITDRLGNSKVTGAAEVGGNDYWKSGTVAVACVSSSSEVVSSTLEKARKTIESCGVDVVRADTVVVKPEDFEERM
jgi:uncharacterized protein YlxP (DUF503 family)